MDFQLFLNHIKRNNESKQNPIILVTLKLWIVFIVVETMLITFTYVVGQQILRISANDPQIQIASDLASDLSLGTNIQDIDIGKNVDISQSLAIFTELFDTNGNPLRSNTQLNGEIPVPPLGVLKSSLSSGMNKITWEPEANIRMAIVTVPYYDFKTGSVEGYVLVGRSLKEIENRESLFLVLTFIAWLFMVAVTAVILLGFGYLFSKKVET